MYYLNIGVLGSFCNTSMVVISLRDVDKTTTTVKYAPIETLGNIKDYYVPFV